MVDVTVTNSGDPVENDEPAISTDSRLGRVPFVLRIGVTGHISLPDQAAMIEPVRQALQLIVAAVLVPPPREFVLVAVSALAEGADRIVAREVLSNPGSRLEVALPRSRADYATDFDGPDSVSEFHALLERAAKIWQAPPFGTREEGYEWAGRRVVDKCDVLIALWDGLPSRGRGGTAEIVAYARERKVPLVWIRTSGEPVLNPEMESEQIEPLREAVRDLNNYDAGRIKGDAFESQLTRQLAYFGLNCDAPDAIEHPLGPACARLADWLLPFFVRADILALRLQSRFRAISIAMFVMAALAVAIVAVQVTFWPSANWVAVFEIALLLMLLGLPVLHGRLRLHERWTSHRFLAERLRSAYFLALARTGDRAQQHGTQISFADPSVAWIERALAEILAHRPRTDSDVTDVEALRSYLSTYWIDDQRSWHSEASARHDKWDTRLRLATATLFGITLISAILHFVLGGHGGTRPDTGAATLIVLSISIPAIGAAVHGIQTEGMDKHHSERYKRMARLLESLASEMTNARDLRQIQEVAVKVERVMREESNDWFGVMRFHDVELIT